MKGNFGFTCSSDYFGLVCACVTLFFHCKIVLLFSVFLYKLILAMEFLHHSVDEDVMELGCFLCIFYLFHSLLVYLYQIFL